MSNTLQVVTIGDLHLDGHVSPFHPDHDRQVIASLKQPYQYCIDNGIEHMVFLGDIFHHAYPKQPLLLRFSRALKAMDKVTIHIIPGNHDLDNEFSALTLLKFMTELKGMDHVNVYDLVSRKTLNGVPVAFFPYPKCKLKGHAPPTFCFGHVETKGAHWPSGLKVKEGFKRRKHDYWAMGHIHTYQELPNLVYTDLMHQTRFDEVDKNGNPPPKGFMHFTIHCEKNGRLDVEKKRVLVDPPFLLKVLQVNNVSDLKKVGTDAYYSIKLHPDVRLPKNWLLEHPQVVHHPYRESASDDEGKGKIQLGTTNFRRKVLATAKKELRRRKWKKPKLKRALKIIRKGLKEVGDE